MALGLVLALPAVASHPEASLAGSNFEIDIDANLKVDDPAPPSLDWANVNEIRATDAVNGTGDDSFSGGVKEDTVCPSETTDSIPPNKSDLLSFHVYEEAATPLGPQGYLNLAWSRVSVADRHDAHGLRVQPVVDPMPQRAQRRSDRR